MAREFPRTHTPATPEQTARLLLEAYERVHGHAPDRNTAELYLALLWNENDRGKAIYNNNWGNVVATGDQDYARPPWYDRAKVLAMPETSPYRARYLALNTRMTEQPGTVPTKFRHLPNASEGAYRWVSTLANAKTPDGANRYSRTRAAARAGDALEFGRQLHFEGYIADPGTDKLGTKYDSLRNDIRAAGWFAELPLPDVEAAPEPQFVLKEGNRYRITEATFYQPDWQELQDQLTAVGATNFAHWDDGQNRRWSHWGQFVYSFDTPELVMDVVNPNPIARGATTVDVERIGAASEPPSTRSKRSGGGVMLGLLLVGVAFVVVAAKG